VLLKTLGSADASARFLASWNGKPAVSSRTARLMLVRRGFNSSLRCRCYVENIIRPVAAAIVKVAPQCVACTQRHI